MFRTCRVHPTVLCYFRSANRYFRIRFWLGRRDFVDQPTGRRVLSVQLFLPRKEKRPSGTGRAAGVRSLSHRSPRMKYITALSAIIRTTWFVYEPIFYAAYSCTLQYCCSEWRRRNFEKNFGQTSSLQDNFVSPFRWKTLIPTKVQV